MSSESPNWRIRNYSTPGSFLADLHDRESFEASQFLQDSLNLFSGRIPSDALEDHVRTFLEKYQTLSYESVNKATTDAIGTVRSVGNNEEIAEFLGKIDKVAEIFRKIGVLENFAK